MGKEKHSNRISAFRLLVFVNGPITKGNGKAHQQPLASLCPFNKNLVVLHGLPCPFPFRSGCKYTGFFLNIGTHETTIFTASRRHLQYFKKTSG